MAVDLPNAVHGTAPRRKRRGAVVVVDGKLECNVCLFIKPVEEFYKNSGRIVSRVGLLVPSIDELTEAMQDMLESGETLGRLLDDYRRTGHRHLLEHINVCASDVCRLTTVLQDLHR